MSVTLASPGEAWGAPSGDSSSRTVQPAARQPEEEIIDPEEVVPSDEEGPADRGDLNRHLGGLAANLKSLCVIRKADSVSLVLFIPYARHEIWQPCHGPERLELSYKEFFQAVGRPDLLKAYRQKKALRTTLLVTQVTSMFGGLALALAGAAGSDWVMLGVGLGVFAVVTPVIGVVRGGIRPLPIGTAEAERLAHDFNRALDPRAGRDPFGLLPRSPSLNLPLLTLHY